MSEQEKRDWSELPAELLHLIAQKLPDLVDIIRLRAVCTVWGSSAPLSNPPHQFPWLLELFDRGSFSSLRRRQQFYSLSSGETLTIPLKNKKLDLRFFIHGGVYSGYLPFNDSRGNTLSFFNPLTKDCFSLPPLCQRRLLSPWMVWTGTDPIRTRTIIVVDRDLWIGNEIGEWALYDPRSNQWVENEGYFYHCCYWHEMFFSTRVHNPTEVFDAHSKELLHEIPPPEIESTENWYGKGNISHLLRKSYLVVSSGVILRVIWHHDVYGDKKTIEESLFYIYSLDFERANHKSCWVRIADIGDQIIFLGEMNGFSMTARPNSGFREGCIYFIDSSTNKPYMYDILAGTVERVPCPFERCTWFLPGL